jgi:lambda family phage portal protein
MIWPFRKKQPDAPAPWKAAHQRELRGLVDTKKMMRQFQAAQADRLLANWENYPVSIDRVLRQDLRVLRARCREQVRNNDYAKRYLNLLLSNVVGSTGISVQAHIKNAAGELDDNANSLLESTWKSWASDHCDVAGSLDFVDFQRMLVSALVYDGEFVCKLHYGPEYGPHGVQLEVIDAARIATYKDETMRNGNVTRLGVEYQGPKPVALWIHPVDSRGEYQESNAQREPMTIDGRPALIHCFLHEFPHQSRGIPWLSTALYRMKLLHGYEEAAITAARIGASKAGFITTESGDGYIGDEATPDGPLLMDVEPGSWEQLPAGTSISTYDPTYPHDQYESFMKRTLMGMSSGLNIGYNAVANDPENTSYSTLRQFELENRDAYRTYQQILIKFVKKVRNLAWLPMASVSGAIALNVPIAAMTPAAFQGRRWDWVDPEKDMRASTLALENRLTTRSQIIRERGMDPDEVFKELASENMKLEELGLV